MKKYKRVAAITAAMAVIIVLVVAVSFAIRTFFGNKLLFDTVYQYNYAQVRLPDGRIVEGLVEDWNDYKNSDMLQITINGETYLTHATNAVLITHWNTNNRKD